MDVTPVIKSEETDFELVYLSRYGKIEAVKYVPIIFKGNKMAMSLANQGAVDSGMSLLSFEGMNRKEVSTIWFALREYADKLRKNLNEPGFGSYEDQTFLAGMLSNVTKLLFNIKDNHDHTDNKLDYIQKWLGAD